MHTARILTALLSCCLLIGCENTASISNSVGNLGTTGQVRATLKHGHFAHLYPTKSQAAINKAAKNAAGTLPHLQYYGGPVISNVKPVAVYWGSNVNAQVVSYMPGFYAAVVNSPHMDWLSEYNTNITAVGGQQGTNQAIGRGTYGGTVTIQPGNASTSLQDSDIQTEITNQINSGALPSPDVNTLYMVHFPPGVSITQGGSASCSAFCAYHGTFQRNGQDIYYGVMPDFGPGSGCATGCGSNPNMIDNFTSAASHELIEATTDAAVGLATGNAPPLAWYDQTNGEIGDICAGGSGSAPGAGDGTITGPNGTVYTVQKEWSNVNGSCIVTGATSCTPNCNGNVCGSDGCGGSCGTCAAGQTCSNGQCTGGCTPSCGGNVCGSDGCGGSCGTCPAGQTCASGQCAASCTPTCGSNVCGSDGCGGTCGTCPGGQTCSNGQCTGGTGGSCSHPICAAGGSLNSSCDPCAAQICGQDSYCCSTAWDSQCVGEVTSICGQSCGGGGGGGGGSCAHAICSSGSILDPGCDPCAGNICSQDSYCCTTKWDSQCVSEVGSICGQSCP